MANTSNQKLLITGACGVNKELIEKKNNFPRFNVIVSEKETDSDILDRIKAKGRKIINSLTKISSNKNNKIEEKKNKGVVYSTQNSRKHVRKKRKRSGISMEKKSGRKMKISPPTNGEPEDDSSREENGEQEEGPPPLTESEWSEDEDDNTETSGNKEVDSFDENSEDIEMECNSCTFKVEIPPELEESDQVLINRETGEILIFP